MRCSRTLTAALVCMAALSGVAWAAGDNASSVGGQSKFHGAPDGGPDGICQQADEDSWAAADSASSVGGLLGDYEAGIDDSFGMTEYASSGGGPLGDYEAGIDDSWDPTVNTSLDAGGPAAPEPTTLCLLALGGLALLRRGRK
jgi:hypothetical protein